MILSGYQLMVKTFGEQRPSLQNLWCEVFPNNGPKSKSLIEISGEPGTGKSIVLYEIMARTTVSTFYDGKDSNIIFIDLTHKFDTDIFEKLVFNVVFQNSVLSSHQTLSNILTKLQSSMIYIPCHSPDEFEYAFEYLEDLLWDHKRISLIAIDGLDTYYWDECRKQLQSMNAHYKKLVQRLKPLCSEHNICCAYTVDSSFLTLKSKTLSTYLPHSLINYKIKLEQKCGRNYLNSSHIKINCDGIEFLKY